MVSGSRALVMSFDSQSDGVAATGTMDLQDPTAFSTSKIQGNYVFNFSGIGVDGFVGGRGSVLAMAGILTMDGRGAISGDMDLNDSASLVRSGGAPPGNGAAVSGSYTVAANGRGTAKLMTSPFTPPVYNQTFAFYVVSANKLKFVETDAVPAVSGEVVTMASGPFSAATLKGGYAFTFSQITPGYETPAVANAGVLTADGSGRLVGTGDNGELFGPTLGHNFLAGYYVDATGRISTNIEGIYCDLFPAADGNFELIETDFQGSGSGTLKAQVGAPFGSNSISGNFASFSGTVSLPMTQARPGEEDITGQLVADGASHLAGAVDINQGSGDLNTGAAATLSQGISLSASGYSLMSNGYGSAALNTSIGKFKMQLYQVDNNTVFLMSSDPSTASIGLMEKQQF
jgi:hypothetical protein